MASGKDEYTSVPQKESLEKNEAPLVLCPPPKGFGARHMQALILFTSLTVAYSMRSHLSVTLVAMTGNATKCQDQLLGVNNVTMENFTTALLPHTSNITEICQDSFKDWSVYRTYNWNKSTQEMILFSFFVGYTAMMIPMGMIAQKFGGKTPIMFALAANGVLSILTPWMAVFGDWLATCACRLLQGMTQAAFYPSIHTILGKWAPLSERGRLSAYIYTGSQFGTVLAFPVSGLLAGSPALGWPVTFWLCGVASFVCLGLVAWLGAASPHDHPSLSTEEFAYIMSDSSADAVPKKRQVPWRHIMTSKPMWGVIASHAGSAMGYLFVLTQIPLYMNKVLGVDIKKNGVYSSLPYISMYFTALLFGYLADLCVTKNILSIANVRRVANTIGMVISGAFLVGFCFVNSTLPAIIVLILCLGLHSGVHVGFHVNTLDLAPNFSGTLMSIGNMFANLSSLLVPVMISNVVGDDTENQHKWQIMFIIMASIQVVTNLVFVIVVEGDVQPWNYYGEDDDDDKCGIYGLKEKNTMQQKNNQSVLIL